MTPQEKEMLQGLTDRVNQTQLTEKDPEAEQFLFQSLGRNSDSLYILAQTVLVQKYALDQATQQLSQARQDLETLRQQSQQQAAQPKHSGSFLGNLLGMNDTPAPPPPPPSQQYGSQSQYAPVPSYPPPPPQYGQPGYPQPQYGQPQYSQPGFGAPQSGGFLRSAMTTATGVAAGALAFEGIESLMHGFGHSGSESFGGGFGNQGRPEEIINNNYYGDSGDTLGSRADKADGLSSDLEDRRDFSGSNDNPPADDVTDQDTANFDDSSDNSSDFSSDDSSDFSSDDNS